MSRVLVVDDDPDVRGALRRALVLDGHDVEAAEDGQGCLDALASSQPEIVLLDVMMPGIDGLEVCRRMRAAGIELPVLMLTARDEVSDRVAGLDAGADDYLVKPFALEELRARIRALLRRPTRTGDGAGSSEAPEVLTFQDLQLDLGTCLARRGEREIQLTRTELALLELLMRHPRQVVTRAVMYEHVWGYDFGGSSNSHEVYVGYLRRKLEAHGEPRLIQTIRGLGYALRAEA